MASKTYKARAIVLRKTKLGDKDLIVSMVDEQGMLIKGVAKGARKPGGSLAARLELFSEVDVFMAKGRSLDVVCEARLANQAHCRTWGLEQSASAAPLAELLSHVLQPDLEQPRIYDMSCAAFDLLGQEGFTISEYMGISAASLWKVMAQIGYRPSFSQCASCACGIDLKSGARTFPLSIVDGGVICEECLRPPDAFMVESHTLQWCEALMLMKYRDILSSGIDFQTGRDILQLARMWARTHTGRDLKSIDFLLTTVALNDPTFEVNVQKQ